MKIISWNCCCKFREKYKLIEKLKADIYVIQECENPQHTKNADYQNFAKNSIWLGNNPNKGLGVFSSSHITLRNNFWESYGFNYYLSININNRLNLLAAWVCGSSYIENYYKYQSLNKHLYNKNMCIIGDFNSNSIWDFQHKNMTHSLVVKELNDIGLYSAYHFINNIPQGKESIKTYFQYRHIDKGFHIDYAFTDKNKIKSFQILNPTDWLKHSDHVPIILELDIKI